MTAEAYMEPIVGVGIDIVEIERILKAAQKVSFLNKCYTEAERRLIEKKISCAAANFAGKEAVAKALGTGFRNFSPSDVEILRNSSGAPYVNLYGAARARADSLMIKKIHISLSDSEHDAVAIAIAERGA